MPLFYVEGRKKTMHIYLYVTIHYTQKHLLLKCLDKRCWGSWSSKMPCLSHREVTHLLLFFILQMSHMCCSDGIHSFPVYCPCFASICGHSSNVSKGFFSSQKSFIMSFPSQRKLSLLLQLDSSCNHEMDTTVHGRIQLFIKDQKR